MGNFSRDDRGPKKFGKRNFGNRGFGGGGFGGRDAGRPPMHQATCSKCGQECEVPFRPTGDRPVFCNNCFRSQGNPSAERGGRETFAKPSFARSSFGDKQMHSATCSKCGNRCEVPFKPMAGKAVYCSECFDKEKNTGKNDEQFTEQFKMLNGKLDKILQALNPVISTAATPEKKIKKEIKNSKDGLAKTKTAAKKATMKKKKF